MKKLTFLLIIVCTAISAGAQVNIPYQEIPYNVNYRWGLIDVMIARGVVTVQTDGNNFYGTLDGTSIPWEGRIICVSDTLNADMYCYGGTVRENVLYQTGWYRRPTVSSFRSPNYNPDDPAFYKNIAGGGCYDASDDSMEAITVTSDMLGMYYYAHALDFNVLKPGDTLAFDIKGGYADKVMITYVGQSVYQVNGDNYPVYDCTYEYSYGGAMSGYKIDCKIGATNRVLMYISAALPMGHVEMLYDPK